MANSKIVYGNPSTSVKSGIWSLVIIAAFVIMVAAGCAVGGQNGQATDPCQPDGCSVPGAALRDPVPSYVPLCEPSDQGPCVETMSGAWYVRHSGARQRLAPCPTEQGARGNAACVWVPSAMGHRDQGDMGAYLWGTDVTGFPLPSQVEPR